jgi:hypothetical protein
MTTNDRTRRYSQVSLRRWQNRELSNPLGGLRIHWRKVGVGLSICQQQKRLFRPATRICSKRGTDSRQQWQPSILASHGGRLQQRSVHRRFAVVFDEPQSAKAIHKKIYPGTGGAHHLRQCFLAYFGNHRPRCSFLAESGEQQKCPRRRLSLELKNWSTRSACTRILRDNR